jgi:anti-anti-sigma factor
MKQPEPLQVRQVGNAIVLCPPSSSTENGLGLREAVLEAAETPGCNLVVLDLQNITYMPSMLLGEAIQLSRLAQAKGLGFRVSAPAHAAELFKITRLDEVLGLYSTAEDAIAGEAKG